MKASANELERLEMLRRIDRATVQARSENRKGEPLRRRIEELAKVCRFIGATTNLFKLPAMTDKRIHLRWQKEIKELKEKGAL